MEKNKKTKKNKSIMDKVRPGRGRPFMDPALKKRPVSLKLAPDAIDAFRRLNKHTRGQSTAVIEKALKRAARGLK